MKKKGNAKKLIVILLLSIILIEIIIYTVQENNVSKEDEKEIVNPNERIDYNDNTFFKDVADEVADDNLQDFNVYKDVKETIAKTETVEEEQEPAKNDNRDIISIKTDNAIITNSADTKELSVVKNNIEPIFVKKEIIVNANSENKIPSEDIVAKKTPKIVISKTITEEKLVQVTSVKIVALNYKNNIYSFPKKKKNVNAFKIKLKLSHPNNMDNAIIKLVIKDGKGEILKIDIKKITFNNSSDINLIFNEVIPKKLISDNYNFYFYQNGKFIKKYTK